MSLLGPRASIALFGLLMAGCGDGGRAEERSPPKPKCEGSEACRRSCDGGDGAACAALAASLEFANGKPAAGPVLLDIALLEEKACALGDKQACARRDREPLVRDVVAVYPGPFHFCVRRPSGEIACMGVGMGRAAGVENEHEVALTPIPLPSPPRDVAASFTATCALLPEGRVMCWGKDFTGTNPDSHVPLDVPALTGAKHLSASIMPPTICAEFADRTARCFDHDAQGKPVTFEDVDQALSAVGALTRKGDLFTFSYPTDAPVRFTIEPSDGQVDASEGGICMLRPDRTVACAGIDFGHRGAEPGKVKLVVVPGVADAVELSMAGYHGCARKADGHVVCWGLPDKNPVVLEGIDDAIQLADACAATKRGFGFCWGGRYDVPWGTVEPLRVRSSNSRSY